MKTPHALLVLVALCGDAHAQADADTLRKLAALKALALSPEHISPQQVSNALAVRLEKHCQDVVQPQAGKYRVCIYAPNVEDSQPLAFRHYKTVNRNATADTGGVVAFIAHSDRSCLRSRDLVGIFQTTPVASDSPAFPEPVLPHMPMQTYQFNFPRQRGNQAHVRVVETGGCVITVELSKTSG